MLEAGSFKSIWYEFCHVIDEIIHSLPWFPSDWEYRFCQWAHRYELEEFGKEAIKGA